MSDKEQTTLRLPKELHELIKKESIVKCVSYNCEIISALNEVRSHQEKCLHDSLQTVQYERV